MNFIEAKRKDLTSCLVFSDIREHNSLNYIIQSSITITTTPTLITATSFALKAETNTAVAKAIATVTASATATATATAAAAAASASAAVAFYPFLHPLESTLIEIYHGKDSKTNVMIQFRQQVY
uniref:Uncharacterized protein n=1 Tax=Glossina austeni TaxID=7395 RepID=A0A1A9VY93_GLOAU